MEVSAATAAALPGLHAGSAATASSGLGLTAQGSAGAFPANLTSLLQSLTPEVVSGLDSETQTVLLQLLSNSGALPVTASGPAGHPSASTADSNISTVLQQRGVLVPNHVGTAQQQLLQDSTAGAHVLATSAAAATGSDPAMSAQPAGAPAGQGQSAQPAESAQGPAVLQDSNATVSAPPSSKALPADVDPVLEKQTPQQQQQQHREDKQQQDQDKSKQQQQQQGQVQPAFGTLLQLSPGQSQMLLQLLEPSQQQQQQQQTSLGLPVSMPQQQQALLASLISTAAALPPDPTAAAAAAAAAAADVAAGKHSSGGGSSTLQQLLAMALGGALPGSGGGGQQQQQHGHSGFSMQTSTEVRRGTAWVVVVHDYIRGN
jgi:hypothetical protein